jgi:titin
VGRGFAPHSSVTITIYSAPQILATAIADQYGDARVTVTVPADLAHGVQTVSALGVDSDSNAHTVDLDVTVAPAGLAVTGTAIGSLLSVGLSLLFTGGALRWLTQPRTTDARRLHRVSTA